jgi:triphosphoribosyl-dephospho-CoA synthase
MLRPGECAQLACVLEATARKPGNVTRFADFDDLTYLDFVLSAAAIAGVMDRAAELGVGRTVLEALTATRRLVGTNSNLGMLLLLAPLAAADDASEASLERALAKLTVDDSRHVFAAIRLANPGGLGDAPEQDVRGEPTLPLREVMALAADRDSVARQFANGFRDVFEIGVRALVAGERGCVSAPRTCQASESESASLARQVLGALTQPRSPANGLEATIIHCHLRFMAALPDSHIVRRCGLQVGEEAQTRAARVLQGLDSFHELDDWLRADGHRRNPGTSADLVAASLFVALRRGMINFPLRF